MDEPVNILVVDDLADKRLAFEAVLEELGQNLVLVGSGAEALRELLEREFAVIVLDVNMPDIDGIETAELIRKHGKTVHTPIIFVTAYADEMQTARGYELGAVDYILTPVVPEILRSKVGVFVDLYRAQRRAAELARAEAARAAAETAMRRSELVALATRELNASLDLEASMESLLDLLVPGRAGFAWLAVDVEDRAVVRCRPERSPGGGIAPSSLPAPVRRAAAEARSGRYPVQLRVRSSPGDGWPAARPIASVLPLVTGERALGVLVLALDRAPDDPLEARTLQEILSRAAIAFDNAQLYSSLKREMAKSKEAEEKLQEASRRKDEFLAMLSHELRNPLAPILNAARVLGKVAGGEPKIAWARDVIERQVSHLAQLVDDLLDVSRITQGKITLRREAVELGKVIAHSIETTRALLDSKSHRLVVNLPTVPTWVFGDFARLSQIFGNLIHNAAKYTLEGGQIELDAANERGSVVVIVRDNGVGIEPHILPHVFEVFTQGDRSLDRSQGGLGVGLAVVQRLVELHQGGVEIASGGAGQGTEVRVTLPCISEVEHARDQRREEPQPLQGGKRVLVIDDNRDAAESIAVLLRLEGHEVKTVTDGNQALACFDVFAPHVAVIDIGLPGISGYDLARRFADSTALPPPLLIALTGYGQTEDFESSRRAGFHHHLVKPADPRLIQAAIEAGRGTHARGNELEL